MWDSFAVKMEYFYVTCLLTIYVFAINFLGIDVTETNMNDDTLVKSLPRISGKIPFNLYSGYAHIEGGKHLYYMFAESMNDPANDPLVLWLNGGPGCSSLIGFWTVQGSYRLDLLSGNITINNYAWNKVANMIFLESPAGVGYSYSDSKNYTTDDNKTSLDNLNAVRAFFEKYPQYKKNDFFVAGESYAGVYVSTLSALLADETDINFKGFAIGNGLLDSQLTVDSAIYYSYYHGILSEYHWKSLLKTCDCDAIEPCPFSTSPNINCRRLASRLFIQGSSTDIDFYDIYASCLTTDIENSDERLSSPFYGVELDPILSNSVKELVQFRGKYSCSLNQEKLYYYMNHSNLRRILNIPDAAPKWMNCRKLPYSGQMRGSVKQHVLYALRAGKYATIYNGDLDVISNFLGARWFVNGLGLETIRDYRVWTDNNQVAGWVQDFTNLTLVTVRGGNHFVPASKPSAALKLFKAFLQNQPLD